MQIEEEDEDALNEFYIMRMKYIYESKMKGRVYVNIPYKEAQGLKKQYDLFWNANVKKWMCLEKDEDEIVLLLTEKAVLSEQKKAQEKASKNDKKMI